MVSGKQTQEPSSAGKDAKQSSVSGDLGHRLNRLEVELTKKGVFKAPVSEEDRSATASSVAHAMKISSEFIAGIVVGALLGWFVDRIAGTSPWGLIVFLMLGFGAGVLNVLRSTGYVAENGDIKSGVKKHDKK